ncbi:hypothetical protein SAMN05216548_101353 [Faunimonas pinastri]|uniref:Uncharacterized protein n=1 Tax=Faunimonas pinastri TaxID=1855383 RepID=A0A1H9A8Q4_9HYPH|nr:hypothetical protein [Faunimonas pinastri]SEP72813.1 hypothetical protein SAMN05216548_101353 [Faunimonas pinastri]
MAKPVSSHAIAEKVVTDLDAIIRNKPKELHEPLTDAIRPLLRVRERMIYAFREGPTPGTRAQLDDLNALVSLAYGAEYPQVGVDWEKIQDTRDELRKFLEKYPVLAEAEEKRSLPEF